MGSGLLGFRLHFFFAGPIPNNLLGFGMVRILERCFGGVYGTMIRYLHTRDT